MNKNEIKRIYIQKAEETLKKVLQQIEKNPNPSLNFGWAGVLLYKTQLYLENSSNEKLKEIQSIAGKALLACGSFIGETSILTGPMGVLWSIEVIESATREKIVNPGIKRVLIKKYLDYQTGFLTKNNSALDYLYGVTAWFTLYPYLTTEEKSRIENLFIEQCSPLSKSLTNNNDFVINKVVRGKDGFFTTPSNGKLGFSHGISSVLFILKEYKLEDKVPGLTNQLEDLLIKNLNETTGIPRNPNESDFQKQDWCHGSLGAAFALKDNQKISQNLIELYKQTPVDTKCMGHCHGLGQRLMYEELKKKIFSSTESSDYKFLDDIELDLNNGTEQPYSFIHSELAGYLSFSDIDRLKYWRLFYPVSEV